MVKVIAEVGSNWSTWADLVKSVETAAELGAWAVKFQQFSEEEMFGFGSNVPNLPYDYLRPLKVICDTLKIEFMCSGFSSSGFQRIDPYVEYHKVASSEITDLRALETLSGFDKPILLSTGAASNSMICRALQTLKHNDVTLMYCVSNYPSRAHDLFTIPDMVDAYAKPVGFSDHSIDIYTPVSAVEHFGVEVLEKHVNFCHATGPDAPHSVDAKMFEEMMERIYGGVSQHPYDEEDDMRRHWTKRLVVTEDVTEGDVLVYGRNYGAYRSKMGSYSPMHPGDFHELEGKKARMPIPKGTSLTKEMV